MGNAIWLFIVLPQWYFGAALSPFKYGVLTAVPAAGVVSLTLGVGLAVYRRALKSFWFILPVLLSEAFVAFAGFMRGSFAPSSSGAGVLMLAFLFLQLIFVGYMIFKFRGMRLSSTLLGLFVISYALFAIFVAGMSLTDTWL